MNEILDLIKHYPVDKQKKIVNEALNELNKNEDELNNLSYEQKIEQCSKLINEKIRVGMVLCEYDSINIYKKIREISKKEYAYNNEEYYYIIYLECYEIDNDLYFEYKRKSFNNEEDFLTWFNSHKIKEDDYVIKEVEKYINRNVNTINII